MSSGTKRTVRKTFVSGKTRPSENYEPARSNVKITYYLTL